MHENNDSKDETNFYVEDFKKEHENLIILDLDGTLVDWNTKLNSTVDFLVDTLRKLGFKDSLTSASKLRNVFECFTFIDNKQRYRDAYGYTPRRVAIAMREAIKNELHRDKSMSTLSKMIKKDTADNESFMSLLENEIREIWEGEDKLLPGAIYFLEFMSEYCDLVLITNGSPDIQLKRIERLDFNKYFKNVSVFKYGKNELAFKKLSEMNYKRIWNIGDSFVSDILPCCKLSIFNILVNYENTFIDLSLVDCEVFNVTFAKNIGSVMKMIVDLLDIPFVALA